MIININDKKAIAKTDDPLNNVVANYKTYKRNWHTTPSKKKQFIEDAIDIMKERKYTDKEIKDFIKKNFE